MQKMAADCKRRWQTVEAVSGKLRARLTGFGEKSKAWAVFLFWNLSRAHGSALFSQGPRRFLARRPACGLRLHQPRGTGVGHLSWDRCNPRRAMRTWQLGDLGRVLCRRRLGGHGLLRRHCQDLGPPIWQGCAHTVWPH